MTTEPEVPEPEVPPVEPKAGLLGPGPHWWRWIIRPLAWLLLLIFTVGYVSYQQSESDKRWCRLLASLTTDVPPPTTDRAREIAEIMADMKRDFGCPATMEQAREWVRKYSPAEGG